MASVAEQLLANLSWKSWSQARDLHKRILFTLGVLIIYRLGTYIPLPGINPDRIRSLAQEYGGQQGLLSMFNMVSGGALERMSIFVLSLMPYISASIIVQLMTAIFPYFMALKKEGESGKRKLSQYTRYGTVALASVQSMALSATMIAQNAVYDPGMFFYVSTLITIVGATLFLMWLGEQITARGVGNGSSMIIYAGIMANLPLSIFQALELSRTGGISSIHIVLALVGGAAIIGFIVFMERAYRKVIVQYPRRQVGKQVYGGEQTYMPLKLNPTGVLAPIFATALLGFFNMLVNWPFLQKIPGVNTLLSFFFSGKGLAFLFVQASLIIFFCFFYTTIGFKPEETAENLRKNGAFIPGYRPGAMTSNYFIYLLNRLTVIGAFYITFVVILPSLLNYTFGLNFPFQGTSFLISVSVSLELISQVHSYIISHQYTHLLRRKGRG